MIACIRVPTKASKNPWSRVCTVEGNVILEWNEKLNWIPKTLMCIYNKCVDILLL